MLETAEWQARLNAAMARAMDALYPIDAHTGLRAL
jgi:hypothetical protein